MRAVGAVNGRVVVQVPTDDKGNGLEAHLEPPEAFQLAVSLFGQVAEATGQRAIEMLKKELCADCHLKVARKFQALAEEAQTKARAQNGAPQKLEIVK